MTTAMQQLIQSRPQSMLSGSALTHYDLMSDFNTDGSIPPWDLCRVGAETLSVPSRMSANRRVSSQPGQRFQNVTYAANLASEMSMFGLAPTRAVTPCVGWFSGDSRAWNSASFETLDSLLEPVNGAKHLLLLEERIDRFLRLPFGWDGNEGIAPSDAAGQAAKAFLNSLKPASLPHECHVAGDGEIIFQWRAPGCFVEVAFNGETISWYAKSDNQEALFADDRFFDDFAVDERLMAAIGRVR
jgi:hypothetical protein